ncbi:MFS transporter, NNP family, nitrate/nitrite transporter [Aquiflexum balticum DSM 16537]|uniref:MFS transporter, NNP family, nitrate/nitrite transporter n=1 Tax=Aquiflexum balticum DSM 16537 TaxID=758820 RepID=A0A1W2HBM5_9BACT|nr:MFS transporter [Aquiflexum balticum]SMD46006.1 MFS transporter, NNP family, nitrate/nitrite transporter [Aquiflexum balticum DSM 16537]
MQEQINSLSYRMLFLNTLAFTICFAVWTFNGVMVTYLTDNGIFDWGPVETGWLFGIPILTGAIFRLPLGILTDKYGGKWIFAGLLLLCALPMYLIAYVESFMAYAILSFFFGFAGAGFAVGIGYTSVWFPKSWQGRALGIFGAGNAGAALTTLLAPTLLNNFTGNGEHPENWRLLPQYYAGVLILMALIFIFFSVNKKTGAPARTMTQILKPLKSIRVWRFGFYYFLVFGCFVAFAQWLVPYFVNVYGASLVVAGLFASLFSFPSGLIRVLGGWMSDKLGARRVMLGTFRWSIILAALLMVPKMDIFTPGKGIMSGSAGKVKMVSDQEIIVGEKSYGLASKEMANEKMDEPNNLTSFLPHKYNWQEPVVKEGQDVAKKELLAKGVTQISFEANMWVYAVLVLLIGIVWGIGKAGVYRFIPDYFPDDVGTVGGMVGVIGGLGGFVCPIIFGYLLDWTGLWTSSWILMFILSVTCLFWILKVTRKIIKTESPEIAQQIEHKN